MLSLVEYKIDLKKFLPKIEYDFVHIREVFSKKNDAGDLSFFNSNLSLWWLILKLLVLTI